MFTSHWTTRLTLLALFALILTTPAWSQQAESQQVKALAGIRDSTNLSSADKRVITDWLNSELIRVNAPEDFKSFKQAFDRQRLDPANSAAFYTELATQTSNLASQRLADENTTVPRQRCLARALLDLNRIQTAPGMVKGLKAKDQAVRYFCATGLARQVGNYTDPKQIVTALKEAGLVETNPVILKSIYQALAIQPPIAENVDAYLGIMDARTELRRQGATTGDGAAVVVLEYFRTPAVIGALTNQQKNELVKRVATLLRMDASDYRSTNLDHYEELFLALQLDAAEDILGQITGQTGRVRSQMEVGGKANASGIYQAVLAWVGDADNNINGTLNTNPYNVPVGAP